MRSYYIVLLIIGLFAARSSAQEAPNPPMKKKVTPPTALELKGIIYDKEMAIGGGIHTNGWNISFTYGIIKTYYLTKIYYFDLTEIKNPNEYKQSFDVQTQYGVSSHSFIYGKQNNFYVLRGGVGAKRYFTDKDKSKKGLAVGATYMGGLDLGILKPYYLDFYYPQTDEVRSERYSTENAANFLNANANGPTILGSSGLGTGWGDVSFLPGAFVRGALLFDWGAFDEFLKDVEIGATLDVFPKKVPIMIDNYPKVNAFTNKPFFINLFINVHLGKRY